MKNVSKEFINTMHEQKEFYYVADITFLDGKTLSIGKNEIAVQGNSLVESPDSSSFPLGSAIAKRITLQVKNTQDEFSDYDFAYAVIQLWLKFDLSTSTETINLGKYTVVDPETYGSTIVITATDDMYKADKDYNTALDYPVDLGTALRDSCSACGLTLLNTTPPNSDYIIQQMPTNISHRQFIGLCAMISGGNAVCDEYGRVKIITYDSSAFERTGTCDGGVFDSDTPYSTGDDIYGGSFNPWDIGDEIDAGDFKYMEDYHVFYRFQNCTIATDDVQITGVKTIVDKTEYISGTEGYVLNLDNQLFTGNVQDAIERIGKLIIGLKFRPFEIDHVCYPLAEFGDLCYVIDRKNRIYQSVITDIDYSFKGFTIMKCSADSPIRNSSKYPANATTQAVIESRVETKQQITEYDRAVQMVTSVIANSLGLFTTRVSTENGGEIVYQHNKPALSDSNIVWERSEQGFLVSTDGGKTWNAGFDSSGNAFVNALSVVGISFDWATGGTLTLGGNGNGKGLLRILDDDGKTLNGYIDNEGVHFEKGEFNGTVNAGKIESSSVNGSVVAGSSIRSFSMLPELVLWEIYDERASESTELQEIQYYIDTETESERTQRYAKEEEVGEGLIINYGGISFYYSGLFAQMYPDYTSGIIGDGAGQKCVTLEGAVLVDDSYYSDERMKNIVAWDEKYDDFLMSLTPIQFKWKDRKRGPGMHTGFGAQTVKALMEEIGLDSEGLIFGSEDTALRMDYQELHAIEVASIQKSRAMIDRLEKRVQQLESQLMKGDE